MKSSLRFEKITLRCGNLGKESVVPDIAVQSNVQNRTKFALGEFDEIYEAYGQISSAYPYRQQNTYTRELSDTQVDAAILENDMMYAIFLPGFGGRLWKLYDKKNRRDVVYQNDCLRASNLAVRNAWFSGGVEWNCGIIGHTPFTMDRIFAARVELEDLQILRMYTYERIRGIVYQMDFWLDDQTPALNCHMSIHNPNPQVVPMYWWTNIASPLYKGGRLLVPAHKAYSHDNGTIIKVDTPVTGDGLDSSHYDTLPFSRDFFFELDQGAPRWIANSDSCGQGMIHLSTERLQSRKLFVWGQNQGAQHWQEYLTEHAGPYIELQAGLGKTQYGCIPMAPHTTWEWSERFENLFLTPQQNQMPFEQVVAMLNTRIAEQNVMKDVEALGSQLRTLPGQLVLEGTGDGALQDALRKHLGLEPMREYLDFTTGDLRQQAWTELLNTGVLPVPEKGTFPASDPIGEQWRELLEDSVRREEGRNWYAFYCLSLLQWQAGRPDLAEHWIRSSLACESTACGVYAAAVLAYNMGNRTRAVRLTCQGLSMAGAELSYVKAAMGLLLCCRAWRKLLDQEKLLPETIRANSRIRLYTARAHYELGHFQKAMSILKQQEAMELEDIREGESAAGMLWSDLTESLWGERRPVPYRFDFDAPGRGYSRPKDEL